MYNKLNNMKTKTILVTGGSGFIGNRLLKNLINKKDDSNYSLAR
ncbi:MAG TPA: hypothetical protein VIY08_08210 [Candidatus Nitrosocosmicus sp.]